MPMYRIQTDYMSQYSEVLNSYQGVGVCSILRCGDMLKDLLP